MLQLRPTEIFPISRQLEDPTDENTYYVRAYIRNLKTDTLLATIDLEDKGDQRFYGTWEVQADPSGEGYFISVLTKVFTDANYTQESPIYARTEQIYLVQERWNPVFGGGGGSGVSYSKIRDIVKEELKKIKIPKPKNVVKYNTVREKVEIDLSPLKREIEKIKEEIKKIDIPKPKEINLSALVEKIEEVKNNVQEIKMPETDLSPVVKELERLKMFLIRMNEELLEKLEKIKKNTDEKIIKIDFKNKEEIKPLRKWR